MHFFIVSSRHMNLLLKDATKHDAKYAVQTRLHADEGSKGNSPRVPPPHLPPPPPSAPCQRGQTFMPPFPQQQSSKNNGRGSVRTGLDYQGCVAARRLPC